MPGICSVMTRKFLTLIMIMTSVSLHSASDIISKKTGGVDLVYIPSGSFVMGERSHGKDFSPPRTVVISKGFWISRFEITQKQYMEITGANPCEKSKYGEGEALPVYNISWYQAVEFCNRLSEASGLEPYYRINSDSRDDDNVSQYDDLKWEVEVNKNANGFRLPTEAQWEYCCRAGTKTDFYWGKNAAWDVAGRYSWHMFNSGQKNYSKGRFWWVKYHKVKKVGTRSPNRFGLYDMSGNVAEWCFDRYSAGYYNDGDKTDPSGPEGEFVYRVVRGGSMLDSPKDLTSYKRWPVEPFEKVGMNGLRVVLPE